MEKEIINSISTKQDTFHAVEADPVPTKDVPVFHQNLSEQGVFLRATDTVPTDVPSDPLDKFRLYVNGTDIRFYVYDTVNATWRAIGTQTNGWDKIAQLELTATTSWLTLTDIPARKNLMVYVEIVGNVQANSYFLVFNNDTGNNYGWRESLDDGADSIASNNYPISLSNVDTTDSLFSTVFIMNSPLVHKSVIADTTFGGSGGASPRRYKSHSVWDSTDQVTTIQIRASNLTSTLAVGTRITVYGSND